MKYLIGVVGENGAGKGTFSKIFCDLAGRQVAVIKFSDILFKTLKLWNLPPTRVNLQNLAIIMNRQYGDGTLTQAVNAWVQKQKKEIIILEGVRWISDVEMIRSFKNSFIVYITAKPKERYLRMKQRGEKIGEKSKTYQQFLKEETAKTEVIIKKIGKSADLIIQNDGNLDVLKEQLELFYKTKIAVK